MGENTFKALMGRGFDTQTAKRLDQAGYTLNHLKTIDENELRSLNIREELIDRILREKRPPIPSERLNKVLYESGMTCCICGDKNQGVIVHHIEEYSDSRSHAEDNLVVLCLNHHGEAHTKRELQQNLTPEKLRDFKQRWLDSVNKRGNREALSANPEDSYQSINQIADSVAIFTAPVMSLQFADHETRQELGNSIKLSSIAYGEPVTPLRDTQVMQWRDIGKSGLSIGTPEPLISPDYWREKEEYIRLTSLLRPVAFVIHNQSSTLLQGVRVEIIGSSSGGITVTDKLPYKPAYRLIDVIPPNIYDRLSLQRDPQTEVVDHVSQWTLTVHFGNVQPKSSVWADEPFYIGSNAEEFLELEAVIYADNLPDPPKVKLTIEFEIENRFPLTIDDL
ncbi:HNH endonuclease signature motif containing protein [Microcoleus sp. Pol11C1]|uniref:HNH endonuclease signature motif containing protein n=1 Tax=unclassified Microcoleus TaxID=2642155 RepID=UPI002FD7975A